MNCSLCSQHLRPKNGCSGCTIDDPNMPKYCLECRIRNCAEIQLYGKSFCYECAMYPCLRLRQLDKRYRTRYGMSMLENQENIRSIGLEAFIAQQQIRWQCPTCGGLICVHNAKCSNCSYKIYVPNTISP